MNHNKRAREREERASVNLSLMVRRMAHRGEMEKESMDDELLSQQGMSTKKQRTEEDERLWLNKLTRLSLPEEDLRKFKETLFDLEKVTNDTNQARKEELKQRQLISSLSEHQLKELETSVKEYIENMQHDDEAVCTLTGFNLKDEADTRMFNCKGMHPRSSKFCRLS